MITQALVLHGYGDPDSADIRLDTITLPELGPHDVLIEVITSPINPSDINMIQGKYAYKPPLPTVLGREGVGRISAIGHQVTQFAIGDRVISLAAQPRYGFWAQHTIATDAELWKVPDHISDETAAMLSINGLTAHILLTQLVPLNPGDWIIQNAANSSVGYCVIQFAKALGIKTINLVRRTDVIDDLRQLGGNIVMTEADYIPDGTLSLALNAVGGPSATILSKALAPGGTMVTYGAMSKEPIPLSNAALIYKELTFKGFLRSRWIEKNGVTAARSHMDMLSTLPLIPKAKSMIMPTEMTILSVLEKIVIY
jgi:trans-2-enoyl-CoA reductase